jgi:exoribonuclease-2
VLSLYARFDHNYRLLGTDLITDFVRISANLSYAEADKLATSQDFAPLFQIATSLKLLRDCPVEKETNRYLYSFKACNQKVQIKKIDTLSPSRAMVEELMIFYNSSIAVFASESKLPVLYRNVNQYFGVNEQVLNSTAFLSTQSEYHPGIGTEAYLHATSPIRRYVDLINQTQVTAMLNNTNPEYTKEDLDQMITLIERRLQLLRDTYNKSERYWCLRYIDQNLLNNPVRGYLKGFWGEYLKVEILPWGKHVLLLTDSRPEDDYFTFVPYFIDWNNYFIKADIV